MMEEENKPGRTTPLPLSQLTPHREPFRSPPGLALRQFFRRNLLIAIATLIFIAITIMVLIQIDRVYFHREKSDIISDMIKGQRLLADQSMTTLDRLTREYSEQFLAKRGDGDLSEEAASQRNERRLIKIEQIREEARQLLDRHPYVFRVALTDLGNDEIVSVAEPERKDIQNNWQNSLFLLNFEQRWTQLKMASFREGNVDVAQPVGVLVVYLTTPRGVAEIHQLTQKWRLRSGLIVLFICMFYGFILWGLLLPVRNVIMALDKGAAIGSPLIDRPRTVLEKYYNNLARDATLSIFSAGLRDFISSQKLTDQYPLMEYAPKMICELFPVSAAEIWVFRRENAVENWTVELHVTGGADPRPDFGGVLRERLDVLLSPHRDNEPGAKIYDYYDENERLTFWFPELLNESETSASLLVVHLKGLRYGTAAWWERLLENVSREVRFAMRTVAEQRKLILQEKSKANISLSRNIGHDLTNIIATSKLELMNVKMLLDAPRDEIYNSPVKQEIFKESLQALLNNTRFLQETVNLYRSFTYLSRPKFEMVNMNELVADVCALFQLSISRNLQVAQNLDPGLQPLEVEPRLIRLALFNLLNNAADSIKRASSADKPSGQITIGTHGLKDGSGVEIIIEDSGEGIRDREGRLLEQHEIEAIFQLGYSTKEKDSGEGLGLNWVQQIVQEFHGGTISGRNKKDDGAAFMISLHTALDQHSGKSAYKSSDEEAGSTA